MSAPPSQEQIESLIRQITGIRLFDRSAAAERDDRVDRGSAAERFDRVDRGSAAERFDRSASGSAARSASGSAAEITLKSMLETLDDIAVKDEDEGNGIISEIKLKVIDKAMVKGSGIYTDETGRRVGVCSVYIYLFDSNDYHKHLDIHADTIISIEEFKCDLPYGKKLLGKVLKYIKDNLRNKNGREFTYVAFEPQENLRDIGAKYHTYRTRRPGITDISDSDIRKYTFGYGYLEDIMRACLYGVRKRSPVFSSDDDDSSSLAVAGIFSQGGKKNHTNRKYTMKTRKNKKSKKRWSLKYKKSINCKRPRGFSQRQYCKYGRKNLK